VLYSDLAAPARRRSRNMILEMIIDTVAEIMGAYSGYDGPGTGLEGLVMKLIITVNCSRCERADRDTRIGFVGYR
jgi:hypothetical protein